MFDKIPEKYMQKVKWLLALGWLLLIASLFYDPISTALTHPENALSPFRVNPEKCIPFKNQCIYDRHPYEMGSTIFWGMVVPSAVMLLLVFGHEAWRRICPLAFFSQIPQRLGINLKKRVRPDSWLGRYQLYLQFGLLFFGLTLRLVLLDFNRLALGSFLLLTIFAAIFVGYLYGGRTWCHYFCPMSPVQMVYTGPRGLLGSEAHQQPRGSITQSMCRTLERNGGEKMNCVGCKSHCMDIDAEDSYWDALHKPGRKLVQYGYVGLVVGFFLYYFFYAGNFAYYFSGHWTHRDAAWEIFDPFGLHLGNTPIAIPNLVAVPLTLALFCSLSYGIFRWGENAYKRYRYRIKKPLTDEQVTHHVFSVSTFLAFNLFFIFGGRPAVMKLPETGQVLFNWFVALVSALWLYQTLTRTQAGYDREKQATSLRRQLKKRAIAVSKYFPHRAIEDLSADEIYVLAKVLPDRLLIYKEVLREALEDGNIDYSQSLAVLHDLREELDLTEEEHQRVLTELGIEGELPDPDRRRSAEDRLRIESYRQSLEHLLLDLVERGTPLTEAYQSQRQTIARLQQTYHIRESEHRQVLAGIFNEDSAMLQTADALLVQLQNVALQGRSLSQSRADARGGVFVLLRSLLRDKQHHIAAKLLRILEILGEGESATRIAGSAGALARQAIADLLQCDSAKWRDRLSDDILTLLQTHASDRPFVPTRVPHLESRTCRDSTTVVRRSPTPLPSDLTVARRPVQSASASQATGVRRPGFGTGSEDVTEIRRPEMRDARGDATIVRRPTPAQVPQVPPIAAIAQLLQDPDPTIQAASLYALYQLDPQQARDRARQCRSADNSPFLQEIAQQLLNPGSDRTVARVPTLIAESPRGLERPQFFQQSVVRVGRGLDNDIVLPDTRVSRHHAAFYLNESGVRVKDLDSSNGVRIGDRAVGNQPVAIESGAIVQFGTLNGPTLKVSWEKHPPSTAPISILEKLLWLFEHSLFKYLKTDALIALARDAQVRVYDPQQEICSGSQSASTLRLLMSGSAQVQQRQGDNFQPLETLSPGQSLPHNSLTRVICTAENTRVLMLCSHQVAD